MNKNKHKPGTPMTGINTDRRSFLTRAGAAVSVVGAAGLGPVAVYAADADARDTADPQAPAGLRKNAQLDPRFRVTYERSIPAAVEVMTRHFAALSERNLKALAETLHFPIATFENTETVVVRTPEEFLARAPRSLNMSENSVRFTDHDSWLKAGEYDMLAGIEVINFDPIRVNLAMTYNRYNKDGRKNLQCQGVYCVTNNDGKWAVQLMSTIFTPADLIGVEYKDTVEAATRTRINHVIAYLDNDWELGDSAWQYGLCASITGMGVAPLVNNQTSADPMAMFRAKGVKSRLNVMDRRKGQPIIPGNRSENKFTSSQVLFQKLGHGIELGYSSGNMRETRVLHATDNKAHVYNGVTRFTPAGEEISTSMEVLVVTLHGPSRWGIQGQLGYITTHDRTNDYE
jgi:hypothetical protein